MHRIACHVWLDVTFHLNGKEDFFFHIFSDQRKGHFNRGVLVVISNVVLFFIWPLLSYK